MSERPSERFYRMDAQQLREELFVTLNLRAAERLERDALRTAIQEALDELGTSVPEVRAVAATLRGVLAEWPTRSEVRPEAGTLVDRVAKLIVDEEDRQEAKRADPEYDVTCFRSVWDKMSETEKTMARNVAQAVLREANHG